MARKGEFSLTFDETGAPHEGTAHRPPGGPAPPKVVGPEHNPSDAKTGIVGKIEDIVTVTLVRTSGNNPICCWWINLGGRWYCMPFEC